MSLAADKLNVVQVLEPRTKINEKRLYAISRGGSDINYRPNIATSYSDSQITWNCPPPSPSILIDRELRMSLSILITLTGADPGGGANLLDLNAGFFAPRAFPISSIINTLTLTLNDQNVSINLNDVLTGLVRYQNPVKSRDQFFSSSPAMMDQYQEYSQGYQQNRNPLAPYGSNTTEQSRGGFPGMIVLTNTPTTATVLFNLSEHILLSPLIFGGREEQGFIGVQNMVITATLGDLTRCLSYMDNNSAPNPTVPAFNSITASIQTGAVSAQGRAPRLDFCYITPQELQSIPSAVNYSYYNVVAYPSAAQALTAWAPPAAMSQTTSQTQNIQLQNVPRRLLLYVRERNADLTAANNGYRKSDTFQVIKSVSINWNNRSGLLSSATQEDLYAISVSNGCNMSWAQWSKECGSVLALDFAKDIAAGDPTMAPGMTGTYQLQIDITYANPNPFRSPNVMIYVVVISEGVCTIVNQHTLTSLGVISKADVLAAASAPYVDYHQMQDIYGAGSFFSSLGSLVGRVVPWVEKAIDVGKKVAPFVGPARMLLGVGDGSGGGGDDGGDMVGGDMDMDDADMEPPVLRRQQQQRAPTQGGNRRVTRQRAAPARRFGGLSDALA